MAGKIGIPVIITVAVVALALVAAGTTLGVLHWLDSEKSPETASVSTPLPVTWHLTTIVDGQGRVSPSGGTFPDNDIITLTAIPSSDWAFSHWGGHCSGSQNPIITTMDRDKTVYAYFTKCEIQSTPQPSLTFVDDSPGTYTYAMKDSSTKGITGTVRTQGQGLSLSEWPIDEWTSEYPLPQWDKILILFMCSVDVDVYEYVDPGQAWQVTNPCASYTYKSSVDMYYYSPGFVAVKFEAVPLKDGVMTILPDVTLVPGAIKWVFYPSNP